MKFLVAVVFVVAVFCIGPSSTVAGGCHMPIYESSGTAVITSGVNLRDKNCTDSNVIGSIPTGEVVTVLAESDGWYKVKRPNGSIGWAWGDFMVTSNVQKIIKKELMYDVKGNADESSILYFYNNKIIKGYEDGSFRPDSHISRSEILKVITLAKGLAPDESQYKNCFTDVGTEWFAPYVCYAKAQKWVKGYEDGSFHPHGKVSDAEALKMIMGVFDIDVPPAESGENWFAPYATIARNKGVLTGTTPDIFGGTYIKRGAVLGLLYRVKTAPKETFPPSKNSSGEVSRPPVDTSGGSIAVSAVPNGDNIVVSWKVSGGLDTSNGFKVVWDTQNTMPTYPQHNPQYISNGNVRSVEISKTTGKTYYIRVCNYNGDSGCGVYSNVTKVEG